MLNIKAKVITNSSLNKIVSISLNNLEIEIKIKVTALAVRGKANHALIELISSHFYIKKENIKILSGHTSQYKIIAIYNTDINILTANIPGHLI